MLLVGVFALSVAGSAFAVPGYATNFKAAYPSSPLSQLSTTSGQAGNLCTVCHGVSGGTRNSFGSDFGGSFNAALGALDSDGDGASNITEINAGTFPGNASSTPTTGDTTKPTVTFSMPATSSMMTVAMTFSATDNVAVTGYMVTASSTAPLASATGWTAAAPASYSFTSAGAKTLYAWAKDAAGNVSLGKSAGVTVTMVSGIDKRAPRIKFFRIPRRSHSLTVPIKAFVAVDRVGVTGYQVSESSVADDNNWSAAAPTSHTFATAGEKKLFAFVKDAAGNVARAKRRVVIRLTEVAVPASAVEPVEIAAAVANEPAKQIYSYDPVSSPVRSSNFAEAKPIAIGPIAEGGDGLSLQVSIAVPDGAMDAYVTIYSPSETITDPVIVYTLTPGNELVPLTADKKPWRTQVTDINEVILEIPTAEILPGKYLVSFELTPTGTQDTNYLWWTYFIVK